MISLVLFHPHPASPIKGEEFSFPPLVGGIEGGGQNGVCLYLGYRPVKIYREYFMSDAIFRPILYIN
jgi:hypothetical protein